jgi:hypothetical protein
MTRSSLALGGALLCATARLSAQGNAQCAARSSGPFGGMQAQNVCNVAVDAAAVFAPVAGILVSGGNPFLGSTGGLGGFPHLGITLRVNATQVVIPDLNYAGVGTTVAAGQKLVAPAPLVEGALGIFGGLPGGSLALDALGSAQLLPTGLINNVYIDVTAQHIGSVALGLGFGGRLTLIGEGAVLPAVTVSVMRRTLPRIGVGDLIKGDRYSFASDLASTEYRATIGKRFGPLALGAGAGWTAYAADAVVVFLNPVTSVAEDPISITVNDSRVVGFVDGGLALGPVYLIGEGGIQRGKDLGLVTTFVGNNPMDQRLFGSIGLRFGF